MGRNRVYAVRGGGAGGRGDRGGRGCVGAVGGGILKGGDSVKVQKLIIKKNGKKIFKGLHIRNPKGTGGHVAGTCSSDDLVSVLEAITGQKMGRGRKRRRR